MGAAQEATMKTCKHCERIRKYLLDQERKVSVRCKRGHVVDTR